MCEPLQGSLEYGKLLELTSDQNDRPVPQCVGYNKGVRDAFKKFKSAVAFYKKYKDEPEEFCKDYPEYKNKGIDMMMVSEWRDWLFDYAFQDVIE